MSTYSHRMRRILALVTVVILTTAALPQAAMAATYSYWYTVNRTVDNQYAYAYATWTVYKIDGSSTNVFVNVQGSVQKKGIYYLLRFEPWMKRTSGSSTLGNWNPGSWKASGDGQTITFSLTYMNATISTSFTGYSEGYQPYYSSSHYSVEWRGVRTNTNTVGNEAVTRWYNYSSSGLTFGICGRSLYYAIRTEYQWGSCGNRAR
jgi:hypothetical protein